MKRRRVVNPSKLVTAASSTGLTKMRTIRNLLGNLANELETCDEATLEAIDGQAMLDDVMLYQREVAQAITEGHRGN